VGDFRKSEVEAQHRRTIELWILRNIATKRFDHYDDLHIDRIDSAWSSKAAWIDGGLEALRLASELRDQHQPSLSVALGCSLNAEEAITFPSIESSRELSAQLDWSPPSLYLFPSGREPWATATAIVLVLDKLASAQGHVRSNSNPKQATWYYLEFTQDHRRHRSVFIAR